MWCRKSHLLTGMARDWVYDGGGHVLSQVMLPQNMWYLFLDAENHWPEYLRELEAKK